jgi:adenylyl- and sulfurtransferase ThiI
VQANIAVFLHHNQQRTSLKSIFGISSYLELTQVELITKENEEQMVDKLE